MIAVGGNYIKGKEEIARAAETIARHFKSPFIVTHGNGPQAGELQEKTGLPLDEVVALTQASIGYPLAQEIERRTRKSAVVVLTRSLVSERDPAFKSPSKPVGEYKRKRFPGAKYFPGRGWRRVVPSPQPLRIVEAGVIKEIVKKAGASVVCCGGGGIPVTRTRGGLKGVQAVVDKDLASAVLARQLGARELVILMQEPCVYRDYGKRAQERIPCMTPASALRMLRQGAFEQGTIAPKILAAARFARTGGRAIITNSESLGRALKGEEGTCVQNTC